MKSVQFFGACGMVTGSSYLVNGDNNTRLLVDLGMFQEGDELGKSNFESLGFDAASLSGVVLTHAHLDHCGRLPLLTRHGYKGKIYMTKATRMLVALILMDAAKVAVENSRRINGGSTVEEAEILYTEEDVEMFLTQVEEVNYDERFLIGEFEVVLRDAGHILGSASIEIADNKGRRIVFSGDLGNTPEDMIRPTEFIKSADYVVMESTYGDRLHEEVDPSQVLQEEINAIEKNKGVLLIPSFSIERAQEILHRINHLKNSGKITKDIKIFLDSPMAIKAVEIFRNSPELYNKELMGDLRVDDPFDFPGLVCTSSVEESKDILLNPRPKVIIAGSGMMHGGRILHHAKNYLEDAKTRLLFVGYQAKDTLGWRLLNGERSVEIYGEIVNVRATVRQIEAMSCHADQKKLLKWLSHIKGVQRVFLTHGEAEAREVLAEMIKSEIRIENISLPNLGQEIYFQDKL